MSAGWAARVEQLRRQLTRPRVLGLLALNHTGEARVSNATSTLPPAVYWQTARWLIFQGLARPYTVDGAEGLAITATGRRLAEAITR